MKPLTTCATRRSRLVIASAAATTAVIATLAINQGGVTGAEKDPAAFTVAGDGSLPTKKPTLGDARDRLTTAETGYAITLASKDPSIPSSATDVNGEAGPEILQIDLPDDVDSSGRKALVVLYDYTGDKTYHQLVDLTSSAISSQSAAGLQPPPSSDEAEAAITIAINAERPPALVTAFEQLEGVPLVSPEQIGYVAGAWVFDGSTVAGSACGRHRCVKLLVSAPSGTYLDTSDFVVDLSTGALVSLEKP